MTTPADQAPDNSVSEKPSTKVFLGSFLFLLVMGNPWSYEFGHNILLDDAWLGGDTLQGFVTMAFMTSVMGFGGAIACLVLTFCVGDWLEYRRSKPTPSIFGLAIFLVFLGLTVLPLILRSVNVNAATTVVINVLQAEKNQGFSPAIRADVDRMTRDYRTVIKNKARLIDLSGASANPKDIMSALAAIDLLGADHPASRFVVENGLVRPKDIHAIQVALLSRVRNGDPLARTALVSLAASGVAGIR